MFVDNVCTFSIWGMRSVVESLNILQLTKCTEDSTRGWRTIAQGRPLECNRKSSDHCDSDHHKRLRHKFNGDCSGYRLLQGDPICQSVDFAIFHCAQTSNKPIAKHATKKKSYTIMDARGDPNQ